MLRLLLGLLCARLVIVSSKYVVSVLDRSLGPDDGSIISFKNKTSAFKNNLNPAWIPLPGNHTGGGLFLRVSNNMTQESQLAFVLSTDETALRFE
jgi:hypothetical protein